MCTWHCCIPGPNITTPRTTTTTTTIPPITTPPSNPVAPCLPVCGVCPTYGTPTITTAPVATNTRICPLTGRVIGRKRRSTTQRSCALNSQCPQGSMCCFDGCSGGRVCKREVPRNTSIAYDAAWGNPRNTEIRHCLGES
ncbi:uncharacterized protein LOC135211846 [Macrobrachium nipponense]|uniref:uncharacterized protein LOC135211846 n=1 Tax=Macrobrachium nipponense TaxID=159736 RepID=UPI0030C8A371